MTSPIWHQPTTLKQAQAYLAGSQDAAFLSGGQLVVPTCFRGELRPSALIELSKLLDRKISSTQDLLRIGAAATHSQIVEDSLVSRDWPSLRAVLQEVADPAVRSTATIGGSIASRERGSDVAAVCLALNAEIETDKSNVSSEDWFSHTRHPRKGEIVTGVMFQKPTSAAYVKFLDPASRYPMAGVMIAKFANNTTRVALTGIRTLGSVRWTEAERALKEVKTGSLPGDDYASALCNALLEKVVNRLELAPNTAQSIVHGQVMNNGNT